MEFKALRAPTLTEEIAGNLAKQLNTLPGAKQFTVNLETQEMRIIFDEDKLSFKTLIQEMNRAGCALQNIDAALLL